MSWKDCLLGDIISVKHGYAFKSQFFATEGEQIVLTPGNFHEEGGFKLRGDRDRYYVGQYPSEFLLKKGDIIIAMTEQGEGLLGSSAMIPEDRKYLHNQRLGLISIKDKSLVDSFYLYKAFNTEYIRRQISASASGVKVRHTAPERIYKCKLMLPPLPIQQKIAGILSSYDDLIENNLKRIKLLEEMAQITYEEWFVRLRFPGHESTPINAETGLPVGCEKLSLSQIGEYLNGYAFKPKDLGNEGMPIIKIKEIKGGVVNDTPRNTGEAIPEKYLVETGEILFSWSASLEVVIWQYERGLLNQHLFKVTPKKGVSKAFLFLALKEALKVFDGLTTGATMKHIKRKELDFVQTAVPDNRIMQKFDALVGAVIEEILNLSKQNQRLRQARDILLPRLMTGMIDVEHYDPTQLLKDAA